MNNKHLLITLLVSMMAVSAHADVVYEPLEVASGFNRDVIAEKYYISSGRAYPSNCISYLRDSGTYYSMATDSVIEAVNTRLGFSAANIAVSKESGWPKDGLINVVAEAKDNPLYKDVYWKLAAYNQPNVLTMRPDNTIGGTGTLRFKKVGCYDQVFFLLASAFEEQKPSTRKAYATIHYTDGSSSDEKEFEFAGLGGQDANKKDGHKVRMINIYEGSSGYKKNTTNDSGKAYAAVFEMDVDPTKLIESIEFENRINYTTVMIFGVTGRTADVEAPEETHISTSNIGDDSFRACWEAIEDAVSYRLDVATDIDFQHILEQYNNKPIDGKYNTCKEVAELEADQDYYWRVRSVNSDGGQSASSAPRRVKTSGGDPVKTEETDNTIEDDLGHFLGNTMSIIINRTLWKDGYFNTLCLPFDLDAAGIAASPLAGGQLYTFDHADVLGEAQLDVHVVPTTTIEAGVPYLIKWANTGEVINNLLFSGVTITADQGLRAGEEGQVQFVGILGKHTLPYENINNLFLGIENTLYWPEDDGTSLKGFRAYFEIPTSGAKAVRRGTPARIIMEQNVATDVEMVNREESIVNNRKFVRNGQLFIVHNGILYNGQGQRVK